MSTMDFAPLSSSKNIAYLSSLLPDDLVIEILECLLVKSLLRFRCVSKTWYNMIKSPAFIDNYSRKKQKRNDCLFVLRHQKEQPQKTEEKPLLSFNDLESNLDENCSILSLLYPSKPDRDSRLLGPCNGLILIVHQNSIFICNPALREIKLLAFPGREHEFSYPPYFISDVHQWGFGSTCINNFKVVLLSCIVYAPDAVNGIEQTVIEANLYTSGTNSWRKIDDTVKNVRFIHGLRNSQLFFNGACHWNITPVNQHYIDAILALNINTELFARLEYPDCLKEVKDRYPCLMVLNECLAVFRYTLRSGNPELVEIWTMKEYGVKESWTKQCVLGPHIVRRPLCYWKNEESILIESGEGQLISCSVYTNEITKLQIYGVEETLRALTYKQSLISLCT